jgi:hypothetical protein
MRSVPARNLSSLPMRCAAALAGMALLAAAGMAGETAKEGGVSSPTGGYTRIALDDAKINLAPYVWKRSGAGPTARAEATMPGAYVKAAFRGSTAVRLLVDGAANSGCPAASMPVVEYSVDGGAFKAVQLARTGAVYPLPLAEGLSGNAAHRFELYFRAAGLGPDRWGSSAVHLRIAGIELDSHASLLPCPLRPKKAIGFGDSITEGVCVEGLCPYYSNLLMNNARVTWFPIVCAALDCEYGQLGSGGQGVVKPMSLPPLPQSWDRYDAAASRLTGGLLLPEPDYVFCCMGTNDFQGEGPNRKQLDIAAAYNGWLAALRKSCPHAMFFCVTPPFGWHAKEIAAAVAARNRQADQKVYLIDTAPLKGGFDERGGASQLAPDGCHPSVYGNALLGALTAAEAQKILSVPLAHAADTSPKR